MKTLEFKEYANLGEYIYELLVNHRKTIGVAILKKDVATLLDRLVEYDDLAYGQINFSEYDNTYDKEYYIIISSNYDIDVIPVYDVGVVYPAEVDILLLDEFIDSKILSVNDGCLCYNFQIKKKKSSLCDTCCYDCNNCPYNK